MDWDWDWDGIGLDLRVGGGIEHLTVLISGDAIGAYRRTRVDNLWSFKLCVSKFQL